MRIFRFLFYHPFRKNKAKSAFYSRLWFFVLFVLFVVSFCKNLRKKWVRVVFDKAESAFYSSLWFLIDIFDFSTFFKNLNRRVLVFPRLRFFVKISVNLSLQGESFPFFLTLRTGVPSIRVGDWLNIVSCCFFLFVWCSFIDG